MELRRFPRQPVRISARVRHDYGWDNASILDVSKMGVRFATSRTLQRGSFIELRRGDHIIVAQVMWSESGKAGAKTQDFVCIKSLLNQTSGVNARPHGADRRKIARPPRTSQSNQALGRLGERIGVWAGATGFCLIAAIFAYETLQQPLTQIERVMASASAGE